MQESLKFIPKQHSSANHCSTGHPPLCCLFYFFSEVNKESQLWKFQKECRKLFYEWCVHKARAAQWVLPVLRWSSTVRQFTHLTQRSGQGCWAESWPPSHLCHQTCYPAQSSSPAPGASPPVLNLEPLQKGDNGQQREKVQLLNATLPKHSQAEGRGGGDLVHQVFRELNHFSKSFLIPFGTEGRTLHRQQCSVCTGMLRSVYCFNCCMSWTTG